MAVCTDLPGKEPHGELDSMVTVESLDGVMVSTLIQNARDVGSIPALGATFFFHFHHTHQRTNEEISDDSKTCYIYREVRWTASCGVR